MIKQKININSPEFYNLTVLPCLIHNVNYIKNSEAQYLYIQELPELYEYVKGCKKRDRVVVFFIKEYLAETPLDIFKYLIMDDAILLPYDKAQKQYSIYTDVLKDFWMKRVKDMHNTRLIKIDDICMQAEFPGKFSADYDHFT